MRPYKILYAEDEFTNRKIIELQLTEEGIECDLAVDGTEAVDKFRRSRYDLVILDQYMPGMNGDEAARVIRSLSPEIPLIAITSDDGEIDNLRQAGFSEVFIKPLRGKRHIDVIKHHLGIRQG